MLKRQQPKPRKFPRASNKTKKESQSYLRHFMPVRDDSRLHVGKENREWLSYIRTRDYMGLELPIIAQIIPAVIGALCQFNG